MSLEDKITCDKTNELDYEKSKHYWSNISPTTDGVLGGFGSISDIDIKYSKRFLRRLNRRDDDAPYRGRALDVGAGIGRVSKDLLSHRFRKVDLLEQDEKFITEAKRVLQSDSEDGRPNCIHFFCSGLMEFNPPHIKYDVIWIQWVLCYLTDDDFVEFLKRCCTWLNPLGVIAVKENMSQVREGEIDESDSSITRHFSHYCKLFRRANLKTILKTQQRHFPDGLYKVLMFGLRPNDA